MIKIPTLFRRDPLSGRVVNEVAPEAAWVAAGEGVAVRLWAGVPCLVKGGRLYKERRSGPLERQTTGVWAPVSRGLNSRKPEDEPYREAWARMCALKHVVQGTYELCGPEIRGNSEGLKHHVLIPHGPYRGAVDEDGRPVKHVLDDAPRTFAGLHAYLMDAGIDGIVWHHPDGRMAKVRAADFGIARAR